MEKYGIRSRISSVAFPHSNCRAEIGVKTMKRLIAQNTGYGGSLDTDKMLRAMLQYRNTPDPDTGLSPAEVIFGRQIRDFTPVLPGKYKPRDQWLHILEKREEALKKRHMKCHKRWSEHTSKLPPLKVGDNVFIQNQVGNHPRRWDTSGTVVEVKQFNQYLVKKDGSGRLTLRNRKFLRKFTPYNKSLDLSITRSPALLNTTSDERKSYEKRDSQISKPSETQQTIISHPQQRTTPPILTPHSISSPVNGQRPSSLPELTPHEDLESSTGNNQQPPQTSPEPERSASEEEIHKQTATPARDKLDILPRRLIQEKPISVSESPKKTRSGRTVKPIQRFDAGGGR